MSLKNTLEETYQNGLVFGTSIPLGNIVYTKNDNNEFILLKYNDIGEKEIIVPREFKEISDNAFSGNTTLEKVTLSRGIRVIGNNAFRDCVNLKELVTPNTLISIGESAFRNCKSLKNFKQNGSRGLKISDYAFASCESLKRVTLNNVESIGKLAFCDNTSLKMFQLLGVTSKLASLSSSAFEGTTDIRLLDLRGLTDKIPSELFMYNNNIYLIKLDGKLKEVSRCAFMNCTIRKVVFYEPKGSKHILLIEGGNSAFSRADWFSYDAAIDKETHLEVKK